MWQRTTGYGAELPMPEAGSVLTRRLDQKVGCGVVIGRLPVRGNRNQVCHRSGPRHTVPTCLDHGSEAQVGTIS